MAAVLDRPQHCGGFLFSGGAPFIRGRTNGDWQLCPETSRGALTVLPSLQVNPTAPCWLPKGRFALACQAGQDRLGC